MPRPARQPGQLFEMIPLVCPVCGRRLRSGPGSLSCAERHAFDLARGGHVTLTAGRPLIGDTAPMVAARQAFLAAGHYRALSERVAEHAGRLLDGPGLVVDVGGGTGYYLVHAIDRLPRAHGLVVDASVPALRRAARAHPRIAAAGWNVWEPWPIASGSADLLVNVFAPRNPEEFHRVLRPGGALLVVTPGPDHLAELREVIPLIGVDTRKPERLQRALEGGFRTVEREELTVTMRLSGRDARHVVGMGPSAHHTTVAQLPLADDDVMDVTAAFVVTVHRPIGSAGPGGGHLRGVGSPGAEQPLSARVGEGSTGGGVVARQALPMRDGHQERDRRRDQR